MLFHRSKEKFDISNETTSRNLEEETVRRWRDIAAARSGSDKIVVGRFEDEMVHGYSGAQDTVEAPAWPSEPTPQYQFELGESDVIDELETETFESREEYTLGELSLDSYSVEAESIAHQHRRVDVDTITIPPIHRSSPQASIVEQKARRTAASDASLNIEDDLAQRFGSNIRSALGPGTVIEGTFRFDSPVCVEGTLSGEVFSTSALIVGEGAQVTGKITVGSLIILGSVEGSVEAQELVEIRSTGSLHADIITQRIAIEDGAVFNGNCSLADDE